MADFFNNFERPFNLLDAQSFEANRRGEITPAQRQQFASMVGWKGIILFLIAFVMIGAIFSLVFFPIIQNGRWYANLLLVVIVGSIFLALMLFFGWGILSQVRQNVKFKRDEANRAIRQGQGQLLFGKKGYVFDLGGNTLQMFANQSNGLLPGITYQVYYLEESRFVLSATALYQVTPSQAQTALNDILAFANGFSAEDILANQQGEVSFAQRLKLFLNAGVGIAVILVMLVLIGGFLFSIFLNPRSSTQGASLLCILTLLGLMLLVGILTLRGAVLDIVAPKLTVVQGAVFKKQRVIQTGKGSYIEYSYTVNNKSFTVNYRAYTALVDGLEYCVYYLARTKRLVSIEVFNNANSSF